MVPDTPPPPRLSDSAKASLARVEGLAHTLDRQFRIPGTPVGIGLDGIIGLIPGVGDTALALAAAYIVVAARRAGVRPEVQGRMIANIGIDWAIGTIPLVGDLFDFAWKANIKNARLMAEDLGVPPAEARGGTNRIENP